MARSFCVSLSLLCCLLFVSSLEAQYVLQASSAAGERSPASRSYLLSGSATQSTVEYGESRGYRLYVSPLDLTDGAVPVGEMALSGEPSPPLPVPRFSLEQNYPNPFNPSTTIIYSLPEGGHCRLSIFDVRGRLVRELVNGEMGEGSYSIRWDGRNEGGQPVGSGIYLYRLTTASEQETRRMVVLK